MNPTLDILLHTRRTGRYVTDEPHVIQMARNGLLFDHGPQRLADGMHYLTMGSKGREMLIAHDEAQPKPKPLTRSQRRYREYLSEYGDGFDTFFDFLKAKHS